MMRNAIILLAVLLVLISSGCIERSQTSQGPITASRFNRVLFDKPEKGTVSGQEESAYVWRVFNLSTDGLSDSGAERHFNLISEVITDAKTRGDIVAGYFVVKSNTDNGSTIWALNPLIERSENARDVGGIGIELDVNNYYDDDPANLDSTLSDTMNGMVITSGGTYRPFAGLRIQGNATNMWQYGIILDSPFKQSAIVLGQNQYIAYKNNSGEASKVLWGDADDNLNLMPPGDSGVVHVFGPLLVPPTGYIRFGRSPGASSGDCYLGPDGETMKLFCFNGTDFLSVTLR